MIGYAFEKLKNKNMDLIVANDVSNNQAMGVDSNQVIIIDKHEQKIEFPMMAKNLLAQKILAVIKKSFLV